MMKRPKQSKSSFLNPFTVIVIVFAVLLLFHYILQNTSIYYRKSLTHPFSLHLNKQDLVMGKGEEFHLYVFGINKRVSFSSTNFRVVGVNFNGRIFAYRTGKAFILAKVDGKILKCRVHVIDINRKKLTLRKGSAYRLRIKGSFTFTSWKSSNAKVASVNMFGRVKARRRGSAVIYGKIKGKTVKCTVRVK